MVRTMGVMDLKRNMKEAVRLVNLEDLKKETKVMREAIGCYVAVARLVLQ
jgi:hypothetical protein